MKGACPLATLSNVYVDVTSNNSVHTYELSPVPNIQTKSIRGGHQGVIAVYDIRNQSSKGMFNIAIAYTTPKKGAVDYPSVFYANRYIIGMKFFQSCKK